MTGSSRDRTPPAVRAHFARRVRWRRRRIGACRPGNPAADGQAGRNCFAPWRTPRLPAVAVRLTVIQSERVNGDYDAAILLECDSIQRTRLEGLENQFLINIDHHRAAERLLT